jgi:hypothetical protein
MMSVPGALGLTAIDDVTQGIVPSLDRLEKAAANPRSPEQDSLSGAITERVLRDPDDVVKRTALQTLLEFMR